MSTAEPAESARPTRGKKTTNAKSSTRKARGEGNKPRQEESHLASSFLEPEDDNFDVKVVPSPEPFTSTKKRKSEDISTVNDDQHGPQAMVVDLQSQALTKRQRRTRPSSSVTQPQEVPIAISADESEVDARMIDAEGMPPPSIHISKKEGKDGKKRAPSASRKASSASTASKASLRATAADDEDIDKELEAELNRPLTDNENDEAPSEIEPPKTRRLTRTKPGSKKATASVAPTRRGTRASSMNAIELSVANLYPSFMSNPTDESKSVNREDNTPSHILAPAVLFPEVKNKKVNASPNSMVQQQSHLDNSERVEEISPPADEGKNHNSNANAKIKPSRSKQISRQVPAHTSQASTVPISQDTMELAPDVHYSVLETRTSQDDSGHESDASLVEQSRSKRGGRKAPAAAKKSKGGRKAAPASSAAPASQNIENIAQATVMDVRPDEDNIATPPIAPNHAESTKPDAIELEPPMKQAEETKVTNHPKKKGKPGKTKAVAQDVAISASPEQRDEAPASLPPPSVHSTPRPALSPQSSDAENQPPSSRPSVVRPPLFIQSPSKSQMTKIPLAITPITSPSRGSSSKLQSTLPWTAVDLESIFQGTPSANKENDPLIFGGLDEKGQGALTSPEKKLTVEEWIKLNAQRGEERLRNECERLVGKFEGEGVRALRTLEGIVCVQ